MRWWLVILVCGFSWSSASAQGWAEKMFKEGLIHDFGVVPRGAQLLHKFPITNIYAVPMEITSLRPGCSCITASYSKKVLEPGETATVDIRMNAALFQGPKGVIITVGVGPEFISQADIKVSAISRADVVFNPGEINLGTVPKGRQPTAKVDVEYAGVLPWAVTELSLGNLPVTGTFKELYRRPAGGTSPAGVGYEVTITLKGDAPQGSIKDFIYLKTNDTKTPLLPLLVTGMVAADVSFTPEKLSLGDFRAGEPLNRRLVGRGIKPFSIVRVELPDNEVQTSSTLPSPEAMVQTLGFVVRGEKLGPYRKEIKIHTNLSSTPFSYIIEGNVVGP